MPRKLGNRPPRPDVVDALVLEIHGLIRDQGWLADRALEVHALSGAYAMRP